MSESMSAAEQLLDACERGDLEEVKKLFVADEADSNGWRPMHSACLNGNLETAQWLHAQGAALDVQNIDGWRPMHLACNNGHLETAQWLLAQGAALEVQNKDGWEPMHLACHNRHVATTKWLQAQGAPPPLRLLCSGLPGSHPAPFSTGRPR